jgi:hypothetical protein
VEASWLQIETQHEENLNDPLIERKRVPIEIQSSIAIESSNQQVAILQSCNLERLAAYEDASSNQSSCLK